MLSLGVNLKNLIIFGASSFAEIANSYFKKSNFKVIAHLVDAEYMPSDFSTLLDTPVYAIDSEQGQTAIGLASHFYVAATYTKMNRVRTDKFLYLKSLGLRPASYVSPLAFVDENVILGEHVFIFENNVLQYGVTVGNNCVLWSGNHIGHHSTISENVFVSSHVVISGHVVIGKNSFLGVNSSIYNNVIIGEDNWISPNCVIDRTTADNSLFRIPGTKVHSVAPLEFFNVDGISTK